ncbi:MAG: hypothetical protein GY928_02805 [Colwellia sp.]|nr:hypothetical protein [Colwellia sp.]
MKNLGIILLIVSLSGCVSTWIEDNTGRFKNTLIHNASKEKIRIDIGEPLTTFSLNNFQKEPEFKYPKFNSYDVFDVYGRIHQPSKSEPKKGGLLTLVLEETVAIPVSIIDVSMDYVFESSKLVVFYDSSDKYLGHEIYNQQNKLLFKSGT